MKAEIITSPLGNIRLEAEGDYLLSLQFTEQPIQESSDDILFLDVKSQLKAYFDGQLKIFDIPIGLSGTTFQKQVWMKVNQVPYGETVFYEDIARSINNPDAVRAVGAANGVNPLLVVIPCHRIIARSGALTGYAGGLWRKVKLLQLEASDKPGRQFDLGF
ncbi:methylated-DNA--[protein]-cysteine S-methyltransferase [Negadavirga shengliensis]|uniref:Methylated-DNA--protein-cysteine methyltransferase n=1 Tax=Negadavirga shengliensis TaxID=1389218 RepID=A0ABV9T206_9BACT